MCAAVADTHSYEHWKADAIEKDRLSGAAGWRSREESTLYDYRVIRRRYEELGRDPSALRWLIPEPARYS